MTTALTYDITRDIIPTYPLAGTALLTDTLLEENDMGNVPLTALAVRETSDDDEGDTDIDDVVNTRDRILSGDIAIAIIPAESITGQALAWWYGQGPELSTDTLSGTSIRSACMGTYQGRPVIYALHGYGYDWIDADILGGNGDGKAREKFEKCISCTFDATR